MNPKHHPYTSNDIEIHIKLGDLLKNTNTIEPCFRKCEYTIMKETSELNKENGTLWKVRGRLERILFNDYTSNLVCSPNANLFDLSGIISPIPINSELILVCGKDNRIEIQNVRFFDYGRKFEESCHVIEEIYFDGTMDYKNIIK